ncbi:hemagluttinin repeat family protein [Yersinia pseudotuberculosis YPIII]|nr:hemagluttinin repeat family protein [Yersinia pseudotuberculosis YPIII]
MLPEDTQCLPINGVYIQGITLLTEDDLSELSASPEQCIHPDNINLLTRELTHIYMDKGYITARIQFIPPDADGKLGLDITEGFVEAIDSTDTGLDGETVFPNMIGKPLNITRLDQGLDQANRLPSNKVTVDILPGTLPGGSILKLHNTPSTPWHLTTSMDNYGNKNTGKWLSRNALSFDNPLGLSDSVSINISNTVDRPQHNYSRAYSMFYSVPYGALTFSGFGSYAEYRYPMKLQFNTAKLHGETQQHGLRADYVFYRDQSQINGLSAQLTYKRASNYLNEEKIAISSPTLTIFELGLNHLHVLPMGLFNINVSLEQGLPWLGAERSNGPLANYQDNVEGSYAANATNVNNLAAENSETTTTTTNTVDVKYGGNIAYDGVTRPVEKTIESGKKLDVGGVIENVGNVAPDSVNAGVDLSVNVGEKENKSSNSQAVVTSIKSGDISITAKEDVKDQGTHYQADKGGIKIDAANHTFESAVNRAEESEKVVSGGVDMRIYTTTGEDINVDAKGKGENKQQEVKAEQAQTGSMKAAGDIIINVQENARYQGTDLDSGDGKIAITAGEEIKFEQATSHLSENHNKIDANAKANFGTKPNSKDFGGGLGGGHSQGSTSADIAQVSHLHGKQGIELNAGKDLTLQGTEFGSKNAATGDVQLTAGGKVDFQAAQSQSSKQDMTWSASVKAGKSKSNSTSENDDGTKTHTNNKGFSAGADPEQR